MFKLRGSMPVGKTYKDEGYWDYLLLSFGTRDEAIEAAIEKSAEYRCIVVVDESNPLDTEHMIDGKWLTDAPQVLEGKADIWFETGSEGVYWAVKTNEPFRDLLYYELHILQGGDEVEIRDDSGNVLFWGVIECDTETGYQPYPMNPQWGQQCALGMWVHWIQKGFEPDVWGRLFVPNKGENSLNIKVVRKNG